LPGVLGDDESSLDESFSAANCWNIRTIRDRGISRDEIPDVLLSGNHAEIAKWRAEQARLRTVERRPDLLKSNEKNGVDGVVE